MHPLPWGGFGEAVACACVCGLAWNDPPTSVGVIPRRFRTVSAVGGIRGSRRAPFVCKLEHHSPTCYEVVSAKRLTQPSATISGVGAPLSHHLKRRRPPRSSSGTSPA